MIVKKSGFNAFAIVIFLSYSDANAQWLCREASSARVGQLITACGVGESKSLEEARVKSRESAIEEFKRVCQLSADCFDFDYTIIPKRTDCELKNEIQVCYRALEFEISKLRKKSITIDLSDLESELKSKNQEIQNINDRIEKINQIKLFEHEATLKRQELADLQNRLSLREAEALKLEELNSKSTIVAGEYKYLHQTYKSSFKVSLHYWASKLTSQSENDIMWITAYEHRPLSWLGIQVYGGFGRGYLSNQKSSDSEVPTQGNPNSTQNFNGAVTYLDTGIALIIYSGWVGTYLKGDLGRVNGNRETFNVNYDGSGVGSILKSSSKFSSHYYGFHLGFDSRDDRKRWGVFIEAGIRRLNDQNNLGLMSTLGINYGF